MNTSERQEAVRKFIDIEIYLCQSYLVDELLKKEICSFEDIENLYRPFDGKLLSPHECYSCNGEFESLDSETGECEECFGGNQESQEIFEWWAVSKWFSDQLRKHGEPVLDCEYGTWWGRTCTGQAICLDVVINAIYDEIVRY